MNPNSPHYRELKQLLTDSYINTFYIDDAIQLELNSRTFMERVAIMNETAEYLVDHLRPLESSSAGDSSKSNGAARSGDHIIRAVHYPKGSRSMRNYVQQMRHTTDNFRPGYGCLFTIEFETVAVAAKFFDNLDFYKGPSFGADVSLAQPYVQTVLQREKQWAESHGVRETIVRISVGLEDKDELLGRLRHALSMACTSRSDLLTA